MILIVILTIAIRSVCDVDHCIDCTNTKCDKCDDGYLLDLVTDPQAPKCKENLYDCKQGDFPNCVKCLYKDEQKNVDEVFCVECEQGYHIINGKCTQDCPTQDPALYEHCLTCSYDSASSSYSCASCEQGYHIINGKCTQSCPTQDPTLYEHCLTCSYDSASSSYSCASCEQGYHIINGKCTQNCPTQDPTLYEHCLTCSYDSASSSYSCASCEQGYLLDLVTDPQAPKCKENLYDCKQGDFPNCVKCLYKDEQKNVDEVFCVECEQGYHIINGKCTQSCPTQDPTLYEHCLTCSYDSASSSYSCASCEQGYLLDLVTDPQAPKCKENLYDCKQGDFPNCVKCLYKDEQKNVDEVFCVECEQGYHIINGKCTQNCPTQDPTLYEHCLTCSYDSASSSYSCASCEQGYHIINGKCTQNCPTQDPTLYEHCLTCSYDSASSSYSCASCEQGYHIINGKCTQDCPTQDPALYEHCLTCSYDSASSSYSCASCEQGYHIINGKCTQSCPTQDPALYEHCLTCSYDSASSSYSCASCEQGYHIINGKCTQSCPTQDPALYEHCLTCSYDSASSSYSCASCEQGYLLDLVTDPQAPKCKENLYDCKQGDFPNCVKCLYKDEQKNVDEVFCVECEQGYHIINGKCTQSCPTQDPALYEHCLTCSYDSASSSYSCASCEQGYHIINGKCTQDCPTQDPALYEHCLTCSYDSASSSYSCASCEQGYHIINGKCTQSCPTQDPALYEHCLTCSYDSASSSYSCASCEQGYHIINGKCTQNCPTQDPALYEHCLTCSYDSASSSYSCASCEQGYHIINGKCTQSCPTQDPTLYEHCLTCSYDSASSSYSCSSCEPGFNLISNDSNQKQCIEIIAYTDSIVPSSGENSENTQESLYKPTASPSPSSVVEENIADELTPNKPEDIKLPIFDNVVNKTVEFSVNKSEIIQGNHYSVSVANNLTIQFQDEGSNNLYFKVNYESAVITFTSTNDDKRPINTGIIPTTNGVTTVNIENDNFNLNIRGDGFVNIATSNQNLTAFNISNVLLEQNESLVIKSKNENVPIYLSNLELYNSPYFKANSSDLHIYNIIVQQGSTPTVEDCIVLKEIITGLNTSLNLGQNVNLSSAVSCILYNTGIVSERAAFTGNLSNPPSKIIFRLTQINTVLADGETTDDTEYKMIIAENPRDCKAWRNIVDMTGSIYQTAKCEKNQQGITQLVVSSKKQNKNKLGAGPIAGIAIACVVVVAVIVGVTVYISRKSNLSLGIESTIYESEDSIAI